jgi:hypothetical protein
MGLTIERYHPVVLAVVSSIAWAVLSERFSFTMPPDEKEFLAAALGLGAVLTGFIATAQAILMALPTDSVMGRLRSTGYIDDLVEYIGRALHGGFVFCVFNLIGFSAMHLEADAKRVYWAAWVLFAVYSACTFLRVSKIMLRIMRA